MEEAEAEEERRVAEAVATEDIKARGSNNGGDNGGKAFRERLYSGDGACPPVIIEQS